MKYGILKDRNVTDNDSAGFCGDIPADGCLEML